jgi:hypothetical protein
MPQETTLREKRRGERVMIRVPVELRAVAKDGKEFNEAAETAVVSRFGALLRTTVPLKPGSTLEVTHGFSKAVETFRVVWLADKATEGLWDVGIEADHPREAFWGIRFPSPATVKDRKA